MILLERTRQALETLGMTQAAAVLESRLEAATARQSTYLDFLHDLLEAELAVRRERYLKARMRLAHLPFHWTSSTSPSSHPSMNARSGNWRR